MYDIIIVGGGPAGLTAAIYARRNGKSVLLLEKEGFGGQIAFAPRVENYPGVGAVTGAELAERMLGQAMDLDTDTDIGTVCGIIDRGAVKTVRTEEGEEFEARAVILAAGARHRRLGLPNDEELLGHGVSYCAVCDGGFYGGGTVAVAGGGDSALQEALLLSDICKKVYVIHRRDSFRGDREKQKRLLARDNVEIVTPAEIVELVAPEGELTTVRVRLSRTDEIREIGAEALFISVGQIPELGAFTNVLPLTGDGYAAVDGECAAPTAGIFAAGDCRRKTVRQLTTAVGDGAVAALNACRYLEST
ncbi:MAG: FAD-dependent oxidoreductase [Oscillospiraceae bacterium]|nr:FAD-dependent oxidoreductase [Oscillospiraceae bacterium]